MGYFKRRIDRSRSRNVLRELHERASAARAWESIPSEPPRNDCFVRFSTRELHDVSGRRQGIFAAAYDALDRCDLDPALVQRLRTDLRWFGENLHAPSLAEPRAVFLFKSSAKACMRQIWSLLHGLRDAGVWTEMQTFANPGRIVFEDRLQVAVIPWADAEEL